MPNIINRLGEENYNNQKCLMQIIKYNNVHDITIEFQDEHRVQVNTRYYNFKTGSIKNPYHPTIYELGYIGEGKYKSSANGQDTRQYRSWYDMMGRCYNKKLHDRRNTYTNCTVCKQWLNFQNYAKWYDDNYYRLGTEKMDIDKDLLIKNNKIYKPNACIFTPRRINLLIIKRNKSRGDYPIGVARKRNKFQADVSMGNNPVYLGVHDTKDKAFEVYKTAKEAYIKQLADEYKIKYINFPQRLYEAMYAYVVEITD